MTIQDDIAKTKAAIENLKTSGEVLSTDGIAALQQKLTVLETQAATEAQATVSAVEKEAQQGMNDAATAEQTFIRKYGTGIVEGIKIVLLSAVAGRLLGWF